MLASMIFLKEPFFHGQDNYDQVRGPLHTDRRLLVLPSDFKVLLYQLKSHSGQRGGAEILSEPLAVVLCSPQSVCHIYKINKLTFSCFFNPCNPKHQTLNLPVIIQTPAVGVRCRKAVFHRTPPGFSVFQRRKWLPMFTMMFHSSNQTEPPSSAAGPHRQSPRYRRALRLPAQVPHRTGHPLQRPAGAVSPAHAQNTSWSSERAEPPVTFSGPHGCDHSMSVHLQPVQEVAPDKRGALGFNRNLYLNKEKRQFDVKCIF